MATSTNEAAGRSWAALALAASAAMAATLLLAPILTRSMWILRLALRETSLFITAVAGVAGALAGRGTSAKERLARAPALPAAMVGLVPFSAQWLLLARLGLPFSFLEYVRGPRLLPVRVERDLVICR
jgi:hypothetical protein